MVPGGCDISRSRRAGSGRARCGAEPHDGRAVVDADGVRTDSTLDGLRRPLSAAQRRQYAEIMAPLADA
ncbi:hypothetical protein [Isoptericola sp. NPDC060257]|uniref:hypothetical protein n=1 Tax=Isoptericola sp. NPDC060257 TaxID=3347087 RepID=UPI003660ACB0